MSMLSVAATQMACSWDLSANLENAEKLIREAAAGGAQVILIQELFETPYFCIEQDARHFELATTLEQNQSLKRFQALAEELDVVLPFSWFERANRAFYNSLAMVDADGAILGVYRKSHIPNGPGYQEKNYFNPGDTGFKVWDTRHGKIGAGVCWDQWFVPDCYRLGAPTRDKPGLQWALATYHAGSCRRQYGSRDSLQSHRHRARNPGFDL
jgi:N-carbamoylputrescine amidase